MVENKKNLVILFFLSLIIFVSFFVVVPAVMIINSPQDFTFFDLRLFIPFSLNIALLLMFFELFIYIFIRLIYSPKFALVAATFFSVFIVSAGLLLPLVESAGMIEAQDTNTNTMNLFLVITISFFFALLTLTRAAEAAVIFLGITLISTLIYMAPKINEFNRTTNLINKFLTVSKEKNIFVISFDGIPGAIVKDIFHNDTKLKSNFSDFTFYSNAISNAPATEASMRNELFGGRDYSKLGYNDEKNLKEYLQDNYSHLLPVNIIEDGYSYYYPYSNKSIPTGGISPNSYFSKVTLHKYWFDLILVRVFTNISVSKLHLDYVNESIQKILTANKSNRNMSNLIKNYQGVSSWKAPLLSALDDYHAFIEELNVGGASKFSIRLLHFVHTHFPVDLDSNCNMRSTDGAWAKSVQNYEGLYSQTKCALHQFQDFLDKLKKLKIYDNSLVIIKSDHGEPAFYFNKAPDNLELNAHNYWGYNRYRPLLMIKDFGIIRESMEYNEDITPLSDLALTLCKASNLKAQICSQFPGKDLLITDNSLKPSKIFLEVVRSEKSDHKFDTHKTIAIDRTENFNFYELLKNHPDIYLSEPKKN